MLLLSFPIGILSGEKLFQPKVYIFHLYMFEEFYSTFYQIPVTPLRQLCFGGDEFVGFYVDVFIVFVEARRDAG